MPKLQQTWLEELQSLVTNRLDLDRLQGKRIAAILGDVPSTYAKSPQLWNAAFKALELEAVFVPLDVPADRLREVVQLFRTSETFLGGSVTVPYKQAVIPLLDEVDPLTARIGAVNVVVRTPEGRLVGHNTDGLGGVLALTDAVLPGSSAPLGDVRGLRVLLIGSGGAAQALAVFLWDRLSDGELVIANRTASGAEGLAKRLSDMRAGRVVAIPESAIASRLESADLVINATVKGQAGIRKLPDGRWTCLEPYSSLAPADPPALAPPSGAEAQRVFFETWFGQAREDIQRNHGLSLEAYERLPRAALCYDIIYAPLETTFLRHARFSGHAVLNGKAMNVAQAVEAFCRFVCRDWLQQLKRDSASTHQLVAQAMAGEWAK